MITSFKRRKSWPSLPPPAVMMTMMLMSMMKVAIYDVDVDIDANDYYYCAHDEISRWSREAFLWQNGGQIYQW